MALMTPPLPLKYYSNSWQQIRVGLRTKRCFVKQRYNT
jgi:hypothetical protein